MMKFILPVLMFVAGAQAHALAVTFNEGPELESYKATALAAMGDRQMCAYEGTSGGWSIDALVRTAYQVVVQEGTEIQYTFNNVVTPLNHADLAQVTLTLSEERNSVLKYSVTDFVLTKTSKGGEKYVFGRTCIH